MTLTSDGAALLAAIREHPDEDTPRLMYADWLEENPNATCPGCKGTTGPGWFCKQCDGTGYGDNKRADLIRIQVEAERCRRVGNPQCTGGSAAWCPVCGDCTCQKREESLADVGCPLHCPLTSTHDELGHATYLDCEAKAILDEWQETWRGDDAGGLMESHMTGQFEEVRKWEHEVTYHRGMKRVHCRAEEVWEAKRRTCTRCRRGKIRGDSTHPNDTQDCEYCGGSGFVLGDFAPTTWALAVCRAHPDVVEFWITDREPYAGVPGGFSAGCFGWNTDRPAPALGHFAASEVPDPVHRLLSPCVLGESGAALWRWYKTADAARTVLARAAVRWVHSSL